MILTGIAALAVALIQFVLLALALSAVMAKHYLRGVVFVIVKVAVYIAAALILVKLFRVFITAAAIGFGAGFFICVFAYFLWTLKKKR